MDDWWMDMLCLMDVCLFLAFSDLDRDFWNNNDSNSEQQRWSSYPPKEFVLNISPYAPYGDPRLTLKWVSVQAGKRPNPYPTPTDPTLTTQPFITPATRQGCRVQLSRLTWLFDAWPLMKWTKNRKKKPTHTTYLTFLYLCEIWNNSIAYLTISFHIWCLIC